MHYLSYASGTGGQGSDTGRARCRGDSGGLAAMRYMLPCEKSCSALEQKQHRELFNKYALQLRRLCLVEGPNNIFQAMLPLQTCQHVLGSLLSHPCRHRHRFRRQHYCFRQFSRGMAFEQGCIELGGDRKERQEVVAHGRRHFAEAFCKGGDQMQ